MLLAALCEMQTLLQYRREDCRTMSGLLRQSANSQLRTWDLIRQTKTKRQEIAAELCPGSRRWQNQLACPVRGAIPPMCSRAPSLLLPLTKRMDTSSCQSSQLDPESRDLTHLSLGMVAVPYDT